MPSPKATGVKVTVTNESFDDIQPKASVAANTGQGPDMVWGLFFLPPLFPDKCLPLEDVAESLAKKYGPWFRLRKPTARSRASGSPFRWRSNGGYPNYRISAMKKAGFRQVPHRYGGVPRTLSRPEEEQHARRIRPRSRHRRRQHVVPLGALVPRRQPRGCHEKIVINSPERRRRWNT